MSYIQYWLFQFYINIIELIKDPKVWAPWLAFIGALIVCCINAWQSYLIRKQNRNAHKRQGFLETKLFYEKKLNQFYIPLRHYLENSKTLFKLFTKNKPNGFKTLTHLLEPHHKFDNSIVELNYSDRSIFEKILEIGEKMENLIYEKGFLAGDDEEFVGKYVPREKYSKLPYEEDMTILSLLVTHIIVIRLAYQNKLGDAGVKYYEAFVFPNEVNVRVEEKIKELREKIATCESKIELLIK